MRKEFLLAFLPISLLIPSVRADIYVPFMMSINTLSIFLMIPILIIEGTAAYFIAKRFMRFEIPMKLSLGIFFLANVISWLVGVFAAYLIPFGSKDILAYMWVLIPSYLITSVVETPVVYAFIRKRCKNPLVKSVVISFLVNLFSYILMAAIVMIQYV